jgi:hypothetical protein
MLFPIPSVAFFYVNSASTKIRVGSGQTNQERSCPEIGVLDPVVIKVPAESFDQWDLFLDGCGSISPK